MGEVKHMPVREGWARMTVEHRVRCERCGWIAYVPNGITGMIEVEHECERDGGRDVIGDGWYVLYGMS